MFEIGISIKPCSNTYARYKENKFSIVKQHGYDAVDYNIADTNSKLYSMSDTELKEKMLLEKSASERVGIKISQIHGPWRYPPQDDTIEMRLERMEKMKKAILICSLLCCKYMVIHPIMPYGTNDLLRNRGQETWDINIKFFTELLEYAKQYDVTVCLENMPMPDFSLATPSKILEVVRTIDDEHFKMCLDSGHVAIFPDILIGDAVRDAGRELKVLHIHDNMGDRDAHLFPTKGIINWCEFINALKEIKFDGVFSLETTPSPSLDDETFEAESKKLCFMVRKMLE